MSFFRAWVHTLTCLEVDPDPASTASPTAEQLLDYLFAPNLEKGSKAFVLRYREITTDDTLFLAPAEPNILEKLVWPPRHAKSSYALGNHIGCIALCGMVGSSVQV